VVPESWVALAANDHLPLPGTVELYRAVTVAHPSRADFAISAKVTRVSPDTAENLGRYDLRETLVLAESEELAVAERPLGSPLYGALLELAAAAEGVRPGQALALSGRRQRLRVREGVEGLWLALDDGSAAPLHPGDSLALTAAPVASGGALRFRLLDRDGREGILTAAPGQVRLAPAEKEDEEVSEVAFVDGAPDAVVHEGGRARLRLAAALRHCYDRETVRVNGNVAPATHGEAVAEALGGGRRRSPSSPPPPPRGAPPRRRCA
jgi:hypothetical protein